MTAEEIVESILHKYSSGDETHCSKSDLKEDLVRVIESFKRQADSVQEMHDAWLRLQREEVRKGRWF